MPVANEPINLGDLLKYEADAHYSREQVTVAANQTLAPGSVVARTNNEIVALNPGGTDGTEIAVGVMVSTVITANAPAQGVMIVRHALVSREALIWPAGITATEWVAAIYQLESRGIIAREGA